MGTLLQLNMAVGKSKLFIGKYGTLIELMWFSSKPCNLLERNHEKKSLFFKQEHSNGHNWEFFSHDKNRVTIASPAQHGYAIQASRACEFKGRIIGFGIIGLAAGNGRPCGFSRQECKERWSNGQRTPVLLWEANVWPKNWLSVSCWLIISSFQWI